MNKLNKKIIALGTALTLSSQTASALVVHDPAAMVAHASNKTELLLQTAIQEKLQGLSGDILNIDKLVQEATGSLSDTLDFKNKLNGLIDKIPNNVNNIYNSILGDGGGGINPLASMGDELWENILGLFEFDLHNAKESFDKGNFNSAAYASGISGTMATTTLMSSQEKQEKLKAIDESINTAKTQGETQAAQAKAVSTIAQSSQEGNSLVAGDINNRNEQTKKLSIEARASNKGQLSQATQSYNR